MKNKLFFSALLAACVTCVAQADDSIYKGEYIDGNRETNVVSFGPGVNATVTGELTINATTTSSNRVLYSTLKSDSISYNCQTTNDQAKVFTVLGSTVETKNFKATAGEATPSVMYFRDSTLTSSNGEIAESFEIGTNITANVEGTTTGESGMHNYFGTTSGSSSIGMKTVVNGGNLNAWGNVSMNGIVLNSGAVNVINKAYSDPYGTGVSISKVDSAINLGDITVENGTLTLEEAAITSDITMNSGTLQFLGDCQTGDLILNGGEIYFGESAVTLSEAGLASLNDVTTVTTGALTLNSGTIYVADNYIIDLGGKDLTLTENVNIVMSVDSLDNAEGLTVFAEAGKVEGLDKLSVTLVDATGTEKEMAVSYNSDNSVVTSTIPEPTTATLSLLALAALAARRRRASR